MKRKYLFFSLLLAGSSLYAQNGRQCDPSSPRHPLVVAGKCCRCNQSDLQLKNMPKPDWEVLKSLLFMVFKATIRITFLSSARNG